MRSFLINSISSGIIEGIGAGVGGSEGAAYAGNAFHYNYLTHKELEDANRERAELLDEIAKCKASTNTSCSPTQLVSLESDLSASTAYYRQLSDANNAALATACAAVFSITLDELKTILQSPRVVASPVTALPGGQFVRTVDVGKIVGATNLTEGGLPTSVIKVFTDRAGNLITSYPVK